MQKMKIYILKIEVLEFYNTIWADNNLEHRRTHKVAMFD